MVTQLQDHIHLDSAIGGSPEFAPTLKFGVRDYQDITGVYMSVNYSVTGYLTVHRLLDTGTPIKRQDWQYVIDIRAEYGYTSWQRVAQIKAMAGKLVSLVPSYHPDDGSTHAAYLQDVLVNSVAPVSWDDPLRQTLGSIVIELLDAERLAQ